MGSDIREGGVSGKGRPVDVSSGFVSPCLGVVGYRLGGVSCKRRHRDMCVCVRERERDKDRVGGSLVGWGDLWMCVGICVCGCVCV